MQGLKIFLLIAAGCFIAGPLQADIYEWTDANGVKHFTNYAPPDNATILMKTQEVPYDEAADLARMEADRQYQLELAKLEMAAREAELERREAEAERKAAEAERYAQETERAADQYLEDAKNDSRYYRGGGYYGYYGRPYIQHYKRKYPKKSHYRYSRKKYGSKYHPKKHARPQKHGSSISLRLRNGSTHGALHVKARSSRHSGRGHSRVGSYGYRR